MKRMTILFLAALIPAMSFALEVREGRLKLVVHESTGRFSLYYLTDIQKDRYEALFVDKDPRTSFASLLVDDRTHRLGESTSFRVKAERTESGARIVFDSTIVSAAQDFSFARLSGSTLPDALRIDFTLLNKSDRELSLGLRLVIDTKLGEKKNAHFRTDRRDVSAETALAPAEAERWWISEGETAALMGSITVDGVEAPDLIHIANWKRLNDAPWKAPISEGRNFNLLPYSIGDSAVSYYFDPDPVPRGGELKRSVFLGTANQAGFAGLGAALEGGVSRMLRASSDPPISPDLVLQTDLITVRDLLGRVDQLLKNPSDAGNEEIAALEAVVVRLKERNGTKQPSE